MTGLTRKAEAFTLLEMLVATAMTAVLAGSLYATLYVCFKARRTALSAVENVRKASLAVEFLGTDLRSAVVPNGILAGLFLGASAVNSFGRDSDALSFYCTAAGSDDEEGRCDLRKVEFACQEVDGGEGMVLLRRVTANLLTTTVQDPLEEVLCRDVRSFGLRYFDGMEWLDDWDSSTQDNALPLAVEVALELEVAGRPDPAAVGYVTSCVFLIPCSSLTAGQQIQVAP